MPAGLPSLPNDALASSHFAIQIDGVEIAQFAECSGITIEHEVITLKENGLGGKPIIKQLFGPKKPPTITLKRSLNASMDLFNWAHAVELGDLAGARRNGSIVFYDFAFGEVARYNFTNGWVSKMTISAAKSGANELASEEITITTEDVTRAS
jgi:phage tail-like protein